MYLNIILFNFFSNLLIEFVLRMPISTKINKVSQKFPNSTHKTEKEVQKGFKGKLANLNMDSKLL